MCFARLDSVVCQSYIDFPLHYSLPMDNLSTGILTTICNFLPWKNRMSMRLLSSKFHSLPCNPTELYIFLMRQEKDTFTFTMNFRGEIFEQRIIEIIRNIKIKEKEPPTFSTTKLEDAKQIYKTVINCSEELYIQMIEKYMNFIKYYFSLKRIRLAYLDSYFLTRFHEIMDWLPYNRNWGKEKTHLELYTHNKMLTEEEITILQYPKAPFTLRFSPPEDFIMPDGFWNYSIVRGAKQLLLGYGATVENPAGEPLPTIVDIGINYEFVKELIKKKVTVFSMNMWANITVYSVLEYITKLLHGGYAMFNFSYCHTYSSIEKDMFVMKLRDYGFTEVKSNIFIKQIKPAMELGTHPDEINIYLRTNRMTVIANYACYRGNLSIRDRRNPNRNPYGNK